MSACSFCGKDASQVFTLISTDGTKICDECVLRCVKLITDKMKQVAHEIQFPKQDDAP